MIPLHTMEGNVNFFFMRFTMNGMITALLVVVVDLCYTKCVGYKHGFLNDISGVGVDFTFWVILCHVPRGCDPVTTTTTTAATNTNATNPTTIAVTTKNTTNMSPPPPAFQHTAWRGLLLDCRSV